jgi:tRNA threonylcarbamoyladenosine biosynthesis protein TsaE
MEIVYDTDQIESVAQSVLENLSHRDGATVLALHGDLGAGKTTLTKSIASILGINEDIISPTFVIAKFYETKHGKYKKMVHVDAYRIEDEKELEKIGWDEILKDNNNLLVIEWPSNIAGSIPIGANFFEIEHHESGRKIKKK